MSGISRTTTDHDVITRWTEARGGQPARVKGTAEGGAGLLRIVFPEHGQDAALEPISWVEFFDKFEASGLALAYQEATKDGDVSRFNKLVARSA